MRSSTLGLSKANKRVSDVVALQCASCRGVVTFFRGLLIPALVYFFEPRFGDREKELNFQKERWYNSKRLAWFASCFFLLNMAMYIGLVNVYTTYEKVVVYGILPLLTAPIMWAAVSMSSDYKALPLTIGHGLMPQALCCHGLGAQTTVLLRFLDCGCRIRSAIPAQ